MYWFRFGTTLLPSLKRNEERNKEYHLNIGTPYALDSVCALLSAHIFHTMVHFIHDHRAAQSQLLINLKRENNNTLSVRLLISL